MERFYIKEIAASGDQVIYSPIHFSDGFNIIYGASNTGKSYVINCINFMLGGEIPFTKASTGYDTIFMKMESENGYVLSMTRRIVDGKNGETGEGKVKVVSNVPGIISEDYSISKLEYSDLILKLFGIQKHHSIIATEDFEVQNLTIRQMIHLMFIDEDNIFRKGTAFDAPKYKKINASLAIIHFLLTGDDLMDRVPEENIEELRKKETQRTGALIYLNNKIAELEKRKDELEEAIVDDGDVDIESKIDDIIAELENTEQQILNATAESKELMKQIFALSARLEEARFLQNRYLSLKSQYDADIKRLNFIKDGEMKMNRLVKVVKCPFCDHDMRNEVVATESYIESANAELARIELQMKDLGEATTGIDIKIHTMESEISSLNAKHDRITAVITKELRPQASGLRERLAVYKTMLESQKEIYAIGKMVVELNTDAFEKENEEKNTASKFDGRAVINKETWKELSDNLNVMIKECGYPNQPESRLNIDTVDVVVGRKFKKDEGKGYRAFLNTIMLFNLMKYLESHAKYASHLLILDSPILSLKEKKHKIPKKEEATPGMKESLFRYMIDNCGSNQIIIAENEIPDGVDYSNSNLIEFSEDEGAIRGFLRSVEG